MDSYLGQIILFAGRIVPAGWAACDGSLLSISTYQALYAVLGTNFGGDGVNTFGLPDLRSRIPVGVGQNTAGTNHVLGQKGGIEGFVLGSTNMPSHSHAVQATTNPSNTDLPAGAVLAKAPANHVYYFNPPNPETAGMTITTKQLSAAAVSTVGVNNSYDVHMPSFGVSYLICIQGIYPVRS
jgi:microcystin-dependent protein